MNRIASYFSASYRNANIQPIVPCAKGGWSWMKAEPVSTSNARRYSAPVFSLNAALKGSDTQNKNYIHMHIHISRQENRNRPK